MSGFPQAWSVRRLAWCQPLGGHVSRTGHARPLLYSPASLQGWEVSEITQLLGFGPCIPNRRIELYLHICGLYAPVGARSSFRQGRLEERLSLIHI
eukprot:8484965-Pyramimonas_sp.AAC.1